MSIYHEITKFSKTLMLKEPFYGLFLISLNKELNTSIPTACVTPDRLNIKLCVNPDFWDGLDDNTNLVVLKHELLHIAFFHLQHFQLF
jgi:predicted metal-dependent peptidase